MEISPVNRSSEAVAVVETVSQENPGENRELIEAVKAVNAAGMLSEDNELAFQFDRESQRMVVRVVNRETGDVMEQIPPEYVLRMAKQLRDSED